MPLPRHKINSLLALISDVNGVRHGDIQSIVGQMSRPLAPLPTDKPPANYTPSEQALQAAHIQHEDHCRQISSMINDTLVTKYRDTPVAVVEAWLRESGHWSGLLAATDSQAIEFRSIFTSAMANSSIDLKSIYFDSLLTDSAYLSPLKVGIQSLGDYQVPLATDKGFQKLHMRDVREAIKWL